MQDNWFIKGLVTNATWAGLALIGGGIFTYLSKTGSVWTVPSLYGLGGFLLILCGSLASRALLNIPFSAGLRITETNAAASIRDILDRFGLSVLRIDSPPEDVFRYIATTPAGTRIAIHQLKNRAHYIQLETNLVINDAEQARLLALPNQQTVFREVRTRLAISKIGHCGVGAPLQQVTLTKTIPITGTATEYHLVQAMNEMELALSLVSDTLNAHIGLDR